MDHKKHNIFLAGVQQAKGFGDWLADVESGQPTIPLFDPKDHVHQQEVWAYYSGMREGYKLFASHLGVKLDE